MVISEDAEIPIVVAVVVIITSKDEEVLVDKGITANEELSLSSGIGEKAVIFIISTMVDSKGKDDDTGSVEKLNIVSMVSTVAVLFSVTVISVAISEELDISTAETGNGGINDNILVMAKPCATTVVEPVNGDVIVTILSVDNDTFIEPTANVGLGSIISVTIIITSLSLLCAKT